MVALMTARQWMAGCAQEAIPFKEILVLKSVEMERTMEATHAMMVTHLQMMVAQQHAKLKAFGFAQADHPVL